MVAAFVVGAVLVVGAVAVVAGSPGQFTRAVEQVWAAPGWMLVAIAALPAANIVLSAAAFHALTRRFGVVTRVEMVALIASANLLNFLPMRPGLVGRVVYHREVNRIPVHASARVVVEAIVIGAVASALLAGAMLMDPLGGPPCAVVAVVVFARVRRGAWATALVFKVLDAVVWTLRYWLALAAVGVPVSPMTACLVATGAQAASLIPLAGNGLGLREWAVGWMIRSRPSAVGVASAHEALTLGLAADLVNRAADILVAVPAGVVGTVYVARKMAAMEARKPIAWNRTRNSAGIEDEVG